MSTEEWIQDKGYPAKDDNPYDHIIVDVYRLHGGRADGTPCFWFDTVADKWMCGLGGAFADLFELPGKTHKERCALAYIYIIARMGI